jgi:hypothetical protein
MGADPKAITRQAVDLIADEVKTLFRTCTNYRRQILFTMREAGIRLLRARRQLKHGEFVDWLKVHGIPTWQASKAIRVAEYWDETQPKQSLGEFLKACPSQRRKLPAIATPAPKPQPADDDDDFDDDDEATLEREADIASSENDRRPAAPAALPPRPPLMLPAHVPDSSSDNTYYNARDREALRIGRAMLDAFEDGPAMVSIQFDRDFTVSFRGRSGRREATRETLAQAVEAVTGISGGMLVCKGPCEKQFPAEALDGGLCRVCRRMRAAERRSGDRRN